jgi:hypothetical protein
MILVLTVLIETMRNGVIACLDRYCEIVPEGER